MIKLDLAAIEKGRTQGSLLGKFLIAAPTIRDARFARSLILVYEHNQNGAKGFMINRHSDRVSFPELSRQLNIQASDPPSPPIFQGGAQDASRGFVLHSDDRRYRASHPIADGLMWCGTIDPLTDIANHAGPTRRLVVLGHTQWHDDQLDNEIADHSWLVGDLDLDILFLEDTEWKWQKALHKLLPDPGRLTQLLGKA